MKNLIILVLLIILVQGANAQCTTVCGTVTTKSSSTGTTALGTVTVAAKGNYTVATTYNMVTVAGLGSITAGAISVSVSNVGTDTALFNGTGLPAGTTVNIEVPNATLPAYTYNCLTSTLLVLVNR